MLPLEGSWLRPTGKLILDSSLGRLPVREVIGPELVGLPVALAETKPWVGRFHDFAEFLAQIPSDSSKFVQSFTFVVFSLPECLHVPGDPPSQRYRDYVAAFVFHEYTEGGLLPFVRSGSSFRVAKQVVLRWCPVFDELVVIPLRGKGDGRILHSGSRLSSLGSTRRLGIDDKLLDVGPSAINPASKLVDELVVRHPTIVISSTDMVARGK